MIETSRLNIIPLDHDQLMVYLNGNDEFETAFKLTSSKRKIYPEIKERVTRVILPQIKNSVDDNYLFYTFWIAVEKLKKIIVAELGFKGEPDAEGKIEIGYGTINAQRNKGYMTEAVGAMIGWAKQQANVKVILAETDENNFASIKVLMKNNFRFAYQKGKMKWWKIAII